MCIRDSYKTGVIRTNPDTLLDGGIDIRDQLKLDGLNRLEKRGWQGDVNGAELDLTAVARAVFNDRDFNKHTTMTFGYGKEIDSFKNPMNDLISKLEIAEDTSPELKQQINSARNATEGELAEVILDQMYGPVLIDVMSKEALEARTLMRSSSALHAATNSLMTVIGPTGMQINLGKEESTGDEGAKNRSTFSFVDDAGQQGPKTTVTHFESEPTAAAIKSRTDKYGDIQEEPGGHSYGGSVVAPVQSLDAATVAMSLTGPSWDRLKKSSGGNPYTHTIYDAFKVDANGYDVVLEEVNKNWMDANMKWNYLEATYDATLETMKKFKAKMADRKKNGPQTLTDNEKLYMDWMLTGDQSKKGFAYMPVFISKIQGMRDFGDIKNDPEKKKAFWNMHNAFRDEMAKVGYDILEPPKKPTVTQLETFVSSLTRVLQLSGRMSAAIHRTNKGKAELRDKLKKEGYKAPSGEMIALQYYAH